MEVDGDIDETNKFQNANFHSGEINAAILHTMDQLEASDQHARTLKGNRINPTLISCDDLAWFQEANIESFEEFHLIVDISMLAKIMNDGHLDRSAERVFKEIGRLRKKIYVVDNFPEDFSELFSKLPKNARLKWKEPKEFGAQATGMAGGEANESLIVGTQHGTIVYGNVFNFQTGKKLEVMGREISEGESVLFGVQQGQAVDKNFLQISIKHDKDESENDKMLTELAQNEHKLLNDHVKNLIVERGSIIIKLEVEKSFIMTDQWINDVLGTIFRDILASFMADGTSFHVNVERFITLSKEDMLKLYIGQENQTRTKADCTEKEKQLTENTSMQTTNVDGSTNKQPFKHTSTQTENLDSFKGETITKNVSTQTKFIDDLSVSTKQQSVHNPEIPSFSNPFEMLAMDYSQLTNLPSERDSQSSGGYSGNPSSSSDFCSGLESMTWLSSVRNWQFSYGYSGNPSSSGFGSGLDSMSWSSSGRNSPSSECDSSLMTNRDLLAAEGDFPPNWQLGIAENLKTITLDQDSSEFKLVASKFAVTQKHIIKVQHIQNKTLYRQYQAKKQLFEQRSNNTKPVEQELWHGTVQEAIPSINKHGFNRGYCGKKAVAYGMGVYFAVNPSYCTHARYARRDNLGNQYIYLVDVLTGEYTQGTTGMRVLPPRDPQNPVDTFDSVVDDVKWPNMYVIFNDTHAYPKYLITFR